MDGLFFHFLVKGEKIESVILCPFSTFSFIRKKWILEMNRANEHKNIEGLFCMVIISSGHHLESFVSHVVWKNLSKLTCLPF